MRNSQPGEAVPLSQTKQRGTPILRVTHHFFKLADQVITRRGVQPACGKLHSLKFPFCALTQPRDQASRSDAEDAPQSAIEHEGLLSPVQIVTRHAASTTGAITRKHIVVRRRADPVLGALDLRQWIVANHL